MAQPYAVLAGDKWLARDIAKLCFDAGWTNHEKLYTMVAIVFAESAGYQEAVGGPNSNGTYDYGLFQLNSGYPGSMTQAEFKAMAFDPPRAVKVARQKFVDAGYSFRPWYAHSNGSYKRFLVKAIHGVCNFAKVQNDLELVH